MADEQLRETVSAEWRGDSGHMKAHLREMEGLLGRRGRWVYLAWVVAWALALVFMAVIFWSGRVGF
ncbi:MAG: hypothetical protein ACYC6T_14915 [Thermoleophilia bacterium]